MAGLCVATEIEASEEPKAIQPRSNGFLSLIMIHSESKFDHSDPRISSSELLRELPSIPSCSSNVKHDCKHHEELISTSNGTYNFTSGSISPISAPLIETANIGASRPTTFRYELFHQELSSTSVRSTPCCARNSFVEVITPSDGDNSSVLPVVLLKPTASSAKMVDFNTVSSWR